jgi:hypothetical protein
MPEHSGRGQRSPAETLLAPRDAVRRGHAFRRYDQLCCADAWGLAAKLFAILLLLAGVLRW